ncbi:LysE family translocator [Corynebacterium lubricantis]|uniref:LysE family translocator n=1 Tax=Corynebacterium lubricantis TaxID=541095 RepID=UPI001FE0FFFF|nr:LysE family translocator [Corynebacterium lubricantis]
MSILLCLTPGADWAYAMASALKNKSPLPAVLGLLSGHFLAVVVVSAGVGVIVSNQPWVLAVLTVVGALYLVWLGIGMFHNPPEIVQGEAIATDSVRKQYLKGLGVSGLNPKLYLLILVLLPQFVDPNQYLPVGLQMFAIGLIHMVNVTVVYLAVAYGARVVLRTRPRAARIVSYLSGAVMIVMGAGLLIEQLF